LKICLVPYDKRWNRDAFDSGSDVLDDWLKQHASQAEKRGNCRTVLAVEEDADLVVGYFSLLNYTLQPDALALDLAVGQTRYPKPAVLLARLAVHRTYQGQSIGRLLVGEALQRAVTISELAGCEVIVVQALNYEVASFYAKFGFRAFLSDPLWLWLSIKDVRRTLQSDTT